MLRRIVSIGLLVTVLLSGAPPVAMADAFDGCSLTAATLPDGTWVNEPLYDDDGSSDIDWFKFTTTSAGYVLLTMGKLPADYKLELWDSCSHKFLTSDRSGNSFEEIYAYLTAKTWRVRVTSNTTYSPTPYQIRRKSLPETVQVLSSSSFMDSTGKLHFVGEVLNNTSTRKTGVNVRASMYSSSNAYLGLIQGTLLRVATHARMRSPFHIVMTPPASYHHMNNIGATGGTVPAFWPVTGMTVQQTGPSFPFGSGRRFNALITNPHPYTTYNVTAILRVYNASGAVTNAAKALASPSTIPSTGSEYVDVDLVGPWWGLPGWDIEAAK